MKINETTIAELRREAYRTQVKEPYRDPPLPMEIQSHVLLALLDEIERLRGELVVGPMDLPKFVNLDSHLIASPSDDFEPYILFVALDADGVVREAARSLATGKWMQGWEPLEVAT